MCLDKRRWKSNTPVNRDTIFPACSISKFFTSICVMKLHEQGAIDIDHSVNYYLHQWKLCSLDGSESNASIRSVLCHIAGIIDGDDGFYGLRRNDPEISLATGYDEEGFRSCQFSHFIFKDTTLYAFPFSLDEIRIA